METPDYLDMDGRQLRLLLTIHQAGSLSTAAKMLDMNQSTVSYWLELLRRRFHDPLFVRAGNGVEPTERALALLPKARVALETLQALHETEDYDPASDGGVLRLACSAVEREVVLSRLIETSLELAPNLNFDLPAIGSAFQTMDRLRNGSLDFSLMPVDAETGEGIMRRSLFSFTDAVYFDTDFPLPVGDLDAYCARPHTRVAFGPDTSFGVDRKLAKLGKTRRVALQVGDFETALRLIRGTPLIATLPSTFSGSQTNGLERVSPPWDASEQTVYLYWHSRNQGSSRHRFWRETIFRLARSS